MEKNCNEVHLKTEGVGRADVWVLDTDKLGALPDSIFDDNEA